jgi:hypothetical protein
MRKPLSLLTEEGLSGREKKSHLQDARQEHHQERKGGLPSSLPLKQSNSDRSAGLDHAESQS